MKKSGIFFICVFIFCCIGSYAQLPGPRLLDSLIQSLQTAKEDTVQVNTLNKISKMYLNTSDYEKALQYSNRSRVLSEKINFPKGLSMAYNIIGSICLSQGDFPLALNNYNMSLKIRKETDDKVGIAASYNNIGLVYYNVGDFEKSLDNYLKSLAVKEAIGDASIGSTYSNIGNIYMSQNNFSKALETYNKYLATSEALNDKYGIGTSCNNIGNVYNRLGENTKAMQYHSRALAIRQELNDKKGVAASYNNIGNVYGQLGDYEKALFNHQKSQKLAEEIGDKQGIGLSYLNIGMAYVELGRPEEGLQQLEKSLAVNREIGDKETVLDTYNALSNLFNKIQNYEKAYYYHKLSSDLKDSLLNEQSNRQIAEMNTRYDSEKKDKELIKKDAEISIRQAETERKNFQRNTFFAGFALMLVLALFIFRGYRQKKSINVQLQDKNELIESQKTLVEEKNKKITDSINYARRIQKAILPDDALIASCLPESFIFFKPKDIVSGDFYWLFKADNPNNDELESVKNVYTQNQFLLAAVDCTGHGVPGALMSMMGYNLLEQVVKEHGIYQPAMILDELSRLVIESLYHKDGRDGVKDGMDIALCKINAETNELEYAGAHNPLYIIRGGNLIEIKADKRPVGLSTKPGKFTNHLIKLEDGDVIYIFSDGFVDQKGGPENKKFFYQPFQQLLLQIHKLSMSQQQQELERVINEWKGHNEQIDDILVIGVKFDLKRTK
jgi:serine phosphatase RsbU (regulator of sigma subunit)